MRFSQVVTYVSCVRARANIQIYLRIHDLSFKAIDLRYYVLCHLINYSALAYCAFRFFAKREKYEGKEELKWNGDAENV